MLILSHRSTRVSLIDFVLTSIMRGILLSLCSDFFFTHASFSHYTCWLRDRINIQIKPTLSNTADFNIWIFLVKNSIMKIKRTFLYMQKKWLKRLVNCVKWKRRKRQGNGSFESGWPPPRMCVWCYVKVRGVKYLLGQAGDLGGRPKDLLHWPPLQFIILHSI